MRFIDRLNTAQKVVLVIAIGIALAAVGRHLVSLRSGFHAGWTGHRFLPGPARPYGAAPSRWMSVVIWLGIDGIWAAASLVVLRTPHGASDPR